jgi:hypothetical protein
MRKHETDITRKLISRDYVYNNIYSLFPDSLFLDKDFRIIGLSVNIQRTLGYSIKEIEGKSISHIESSGHFEDVLRQQLQNGYFNDKKIHVNKKRGGTICYSVSGFYLGILAGEGSGLIILRFNNQEELENLDHTLRQTKSQVDDFIYRTAHDLRGPLATIQGLVNLLKMRKDDVEVDRFIYMIEANSKILDERLHQMVYLAKIDEHVEQATYEFKFSALETELRKIIGSSPFIDFHDFTVTSPEAEIHGYDEIQIRLIAENIILYILSRPRGNTKSCIRIQVSENHDMLTITINVEGFVADPEVHEQMKEINTSMYIDLLRSSKLTYLFAAQKIALQSKALISIDFIGMENQQISVIIPKKQELAFGNIATCPDNQ